MVSVIVVDVVKVVSRYDTQSHLNANPEENKAGHVLDMNGECLAIQLGKRRAYIGLADICRRRRKNTLALFLAAEVGRAVEGGGGVCGQTQAIEAI